MSGKIIAVVGFPKSGKSTFLYHLYNSLRAQGRSFFVQRACPDQEGQWTFETPNGKELARQYKSAVTSFFDEKFVQWVISSAQNLAKIFDEVYLDCGGKMSPENKRILEICDKAIIIGRCLDDISAWISFVREVKPNIELETYLSHLIDGEVRFEKVDVGVEV